MLPTGIQLGNYRVLSLIRRGGMGEIYVAEDVRLPRQLAIKVVQSEPTLYPDATTSQEAARLFQREMEVIARLDHPNILPLIDFGEQVNDGAELTYMVMPLRPEGSLSDWLRRRGSAEPLPPDDVGHFVRQTASALSYAHSKGLVHQDVKPSNFLIREREGQPGRPDLLLADFGIAKMTGTSKSSTNVRGTLEYMAPEQLNGHAVPASDQYALAIMTYQLLTGRVPFSGNPTQVIYQHMQAMPQPPSTVNPRLPKLLDSVILRALAKEPGKRFSSEFAFSNAFDLALQGKEIDDRAEEKTQYAPMPGLNAPTYPNYQETMLAPPPPPPPNPVELRQSNATLPSLPTFSDGTPRPATKAVSIRGILMITLVVILIAAGGFGVANGFFNKNAGGGSTGSTAVPGGSAGNSAATLTAQAQSQAQANTNATATALAINQQGANATATAVQAATQAQAAATATALATNQKSINATATAVQATTQAQTVVQAYYNAINQSDYQGAYNMWGSGFQGSQSYDQFVNGYANTIHDTITLGTVTLLADGTVQVGITIQALEKTNSGPTTSIFQGHYIVGLENGVWKLLNGNIQKVG